MGHPPSGHEELVGKLRAEGSELSIEAARVISELDEEVYAGWERMMGEDL